jgi:hypothetical protein
MPGLEFVVGLLISWFARRAKHAGEQVDRKVDAALDKALGSGLNKIHDLIVTKLHDEPALKVLKGEVAHTGEASTRTQARVRLALEEAVDTDDAFAAQLATAVEEVLALRASVEGQAAAQQSVTISGSVVASNGGIAIGGVTGGSVSLSTEDPRKPARP